jgi:hypothetical protein
MPESGRKRYDNPSGCSAATSVTSTRAAGESTLAITGAASSGMEKAMEAISWRPADLDAARREAEQAGTLVLIDFFSPT